MTSIIYKRRGTCNHKVFKKTSLFFVILCCTFKYMHIIIGEYEYYGHIIFAGCDIKRSKDNE